MPYTVRLCRDLTGWFASMSDDISGYPGTTVQWESAFDCPDRAMSVLDLTEDLAQRLPGETFAFWGPRPEPTLPPGRALGPSAAGARWLCQHYEARRLLAVTQVAHDQNGYGVRFTDGRGHSEAVVYYPSQQTAFEVADRLVGIRHRSHICGRACSGWAVDHSATEHQTPGRAVNRAWAFLPKSP
jgi:hypothetical protein